ncbi:MAG: RNHCP domain-containing protein [Phycisphaerales bacterium]|nr:RNHCP domain-containing protein [Phycisphaerales bacterium]
MTQSRSDSEKGFNCVRCRQWVSLQSYGTRHRNHCPYCLWSRHLDEQAGDRQCACRSPMEPIGIEVRGDGEWALIHRCRGCGLIRTNRIAGDDHELSLLQLVLRPLSRAPFPLDHMLRG